MSESASFIAFLGKDEDFETHEAGNEIFHDGDQGDCPYVVRSGSVDLMKGSVWLETVSNGGAFGEMILTGRSERSATAVAREDATLVRVDQARFDGANKLNPFLARSFMRLIADRLSALNQRLVEPE